MLLTVVRALLKPEGFTKKEALLGDLGWMTVGAILLVAMLIFY